MNGTRSAWPLESNDVASPDSAPGLSRATAGPRRPRRDLCSRYCHHMAIRVECYAGYRGEQEPLAFWLGGRRLVVRGIVDRWFAPRQRWFKVDADDGQMYVLRHNEASGDWELAAYRAAAR